MFMMSHLFIPTLYIVLIKKNEKALDFVPIYFTTSSLKMVKMVSTFYSETKNKKRKKKVPS